MLTFKQNLLENVLDYTEGSRSEIGVIIKAKGTLMFAVDWVAAFSVF